MSLHCRWDMLIEKNATFDKESNTKKTSENILTERTEGPRKEGKFPNEFKTRPARDVIRVLY